MNFCLFQILSLVGTARQHNVKLMNDNDSIFINCSQDAEYNYASSSRGILAALYTTFCASATVTAALETIRLAADFYMYL